MSEGGYSNNINLQSSETITSKRSAGNMENNKESSENSPTCKKKMKVSSETANIDSSNLLNNNLNNEYSNHIPLAERNIRLGFDNFSNINGSSKSNSSTETNLNGNFIHKPAITSNGDSLINGNQEPKSEIPLLDEGQARTSSTLNYVARLPDHSSDIDPVRATPPHIPDDSNICSGMENVDVMLHC